MGNRTKLINSIREKKNHIVRAYSQLGKNNSSYFDALAVSYGKENLAKIVAKFGIDKFKTLSSIDETDYSNQVTKQLVNQTYGNEYIEMELFSSNCLVKDNQIKQQKYICIANKNKVDRKRKFDFETISKCIENNDIVLIDVKERQISPTMASLLQKIDEREYKNQVMSLILMSTPTISTFGKKQTQIVMQQLRCNNPIMYKTVIELQKSVAKSLFLYETSKEQLLMNEAIEEFETNLFNMPIEVIKDNKEKINQFKSKADKIESLMTKNNFVLQKVPFVDDKIKEEKTFWNIFEISIDKIEQSV